MLYIARRERDTTSPSALYLKWLVNLKVVMARTKDVRVEEIELKLERVLQAGARPAFE